jgi:hypothetical protein
MGNDARFVLEEAGAVSVQEPAFQRRRRGGVSEVSRLSGVSRTTIRVGMRELENNNDTIDISRVRKVDGGRNYVEDNIPNIQRCIKEGEYR